MTDIAVDIEVLALDKFPAAPADNIPVAVDSHHNLDIVEFAILRLFLQIHKKRWQVLPRKG